MCREQLEIPGLEGLERATEIAQAKSQTLRQEIKNLQDRVLQLELEISILRIQLEKGRVS